MTHISYFIYHSVFCNLSTRRHRNYAFERQNLVEYWSVMESSTCISYHRKYHAAKFPNVCMFVRHLCFALLHQFYCDIVHIIYVQIDSKYFLKFGPYITNQVNLAFASCLPDSTTHFLRFQWFVKSFKITLIKKTTKFQENNKI
jgi:hypothetical protein